MYMSAHEHTCAEIRKGRETERQIECKGRAYVLFYTDMHFHLYTELK